MLECETTLALECEVAGHFIHQQGGLSQNVHCASLRETGRWAEDDYIPNELEVKPNEMAKDIGSVLDRPSRPSNGCRRASGLHVGSVWQQSVVFSTRGADATHVLLRPGSR